MSAEPLCLTGAQIVIECLAEQGVDTVFGYPGGAILNIYDELYRNRARVRHFLTAHEQGAAHAADGYSRASGKTGVVMATSGPGATNLVTGIAAAYMDSSPVVAITCNVAEELLGKDSFQEVDILGITMPVTKHSYLVRSAAQLADTIREAFAIARSGRPGPVLIDIPKNVTAECAPFTPMSEAELRVEFSRRPRIRRITAVPVPDDSEIEAAADVINRAERPCLYVGGGVIIADAALETAALAERARIPAALSLMGKTAFPAQHPLCLGMLGMHGTAAANAACAQADLVIAVGARFSDRAVPRPSAFGKGGAVLHIDADAAEINKNVPAQTALTGGIKDIVSRLLPLVNVRETSAWAQSMLDLRREEPAMYREAMPLHPRVIFEIIHETLGDDAVIATEVGQHQMWAAQFYPFARPRTFVTSGGLGAMGFGLGAAIGAQIACPGRQVALISGDGSLMMNSTELATVARYRLPVIIVVFHNGTLGMVRQWQTLFYGGRYSESTLEFCPDFVALAGAYGIGAARAGTNAEFRRVFEEAAAARAPFLIDCAIGIDVPVLPITPPGAPLEAALQEMP